MHLSVCSCIDMGISPELPAGECHNNSMHTGSKHAQKISSWTDHNGCYVFMYM